MTIQPEEGRRQARDFPNERYACIVADPPWDYRERFRRGAAGFGHGANGYSQTGTRPPYETMRLTAIAALPVATIAAENAHLYLWTTNAFMAEAHSVVAAWGFRPITLLTWRKVNRQGVAARNGMGHYFRSSTEHAIFAVRGSLPPLVRNMATIFDAPKLAHSEKPEEFYEIVRAVSPEPRIDLFNRREIDGFDGWGVEAP